MLGVTFRDTITLGSIGVGALLGLLGLFVFAYGARYKAAFGVAQATAEALEKRVKQVVDEQKECHAQLVQATAVIGEQRAIVARLEALPNLAKILETIGEMSVQQDAAADVRTELAMTRMEGYVGEQLDKHESRAQDRHDAQMVVLRTMVEQLEARA